MRHGKLLVGQPEPAPALVPGRYTDVAHISILSECAVCRREGSCADQGIGGLQDGTPGHAPRELAALKTLSQRIQYDLSPLRTPGDEWLRLLWYLKRWLELQCPAHIWALPTFLLTLNKRRLLP